MKITKTNIFTYSALTIAILVASYSIFQTQKIKKKLRDVEAKKIEYTKDSLIEKTLFQIDSVLITGDYQSALDAYQEQFVGVVNDDRLNVKFRIEVAQQFMNLNNESSIKNSKKDSISIVDTNTSENVASFPVGLRAYDSLSFVLEKTKTQLGRIKKQLTNKSYGEYLMFSNPKNHQLHYVGQVRNNKANGLGIAIFDTGSRYEGYWSDNLRQGEGAFYWSDGQYYKGEYDKDLRNGIGTYVWPNGEKYVGQWKNDQRDGEGVFYDKAGKVIKGIWKKDKLVNKQKDKK